MNVDAKDKEIDALRLRLQETERAGADIRKKNEQLLYRLQQRRPVFLLFLYALAFGWLALDGYFYLLVKATPADQCEVGVRSGAP